MKRKKNLVAYLLCLLLVNNVSEGLSAHVDSKSDSSPSPSGGNLGTSGKAPLKLIPASLEENAVQSHIFHKRDTERESIPDDDIVKEAFKKIPSKETREKVLSHNKLKVSGHALKKSSGHASTMIPQKETKIRDLKIGRESGIVLQKDRDVKATLKNSLQGNKGLGTLGNMPHDHGRLSDRKHSLEKSGTAEEYVSPGSVAAIVAGLLAVAMVLLVVVTVFWGRCQNRFLRRRNDPELGLATPSMTVFGEELSDEEIIFERKAAGNKNESSTHQSNSRPQGTSPPEQSIINLG